MKSSDNLYKGKDGNPALVASSKRLKQTTQRYWAELSYNIPVIALCVDLSTETVYMTEPLFWDSVVLLDATESTKTIKFRCDLDDDVILERVRDIAKGYSLREELYGHKWLLRNICQIFEMYTDSWWLDRCCQNIDVEFFKTFLDNVRVFMLPVLQKNKSMDAGTEQLFTYDYYYKKSDYDEPYNYVIYEGLRKFFLGLLRLLDFYRGRVLASGYFWVYNDDEYLKLVAETEIPTFENEKELEDFNFDEYFRKQKKSGWFTDCLATIEETAKCEKNELMGYLIGKYGHYTL